MTAKITKNEWCKKFVIEHYNNCIKCIDQPDEYLIMDKIYKCDFDMVILKDLFSANNLIVYLIFTWGSQVSWDSWKNGFITASRKIPVTAVLSVFSTIKCIFSILHLFFCFSCTVKLQGQKMHWSNKYLIVYSGNVWQHLSKDKHRQ